MEKPGSSQMNQVVLRKPKKEQSVNSELDHQKQADEKKRRLEKALATSAAIISELEKKKAGSSQMNQVVLKKPKKKQPVNSESDRQKQAEKKKRRLEKALAASAAIISELEKKKQKKKEEQERLDEEGARVAEAVALHVLLGEDTTEDLMETGMHVRSGGDSRILSGCSMGYANGGFGWGGCELHHNGERSWCDRGTGGFLFPSVGPMRKVGSWLYDEAGRIDFCPGFVAAQAVSSLQIREDGLQEARGW